ncbi:MAG: Bifunctional (p)ppGpp synthase/hydrolase relA [Chloroflexi bacterium ADurb.Bin325]|nr:MAG: Bifunctional (p)ppGpp synthase/hydrolase relA [Chloroflexi bacterium ADurb.Bin325]
MTWDTLLNQLPKSYTQQDVALVRRAYEVAEQAHGTQLRKSGEAYIVHPVAVAGILADLRLDAKTVAAALLHDVAEDTAVKMPEVAEEFGAEVASMVDGVTKLSNVAHMASLPADSRDPRVESLRKMMLAMSNDVRVVLIKLADRLHNMRTIAYVSREKQMRISRETLDIYAPLANLLGIYRIKWELEDLAFRCLMPETYEKMQRVLIEQREEREVYVRGVVTQLQDELARHNIQATITGRPKHIYSIYRKMNRKGVDMEQVYDQQGVRIIVPEIGDCYVTLGVVHTLWQPIKGEFDDYIATPKGNQYQSLHTAVYGPGGRPLEVQIRTPEMDRIAEIGIAAHWRYKSQTRHDEAYERKIAWLRSLIEWQSQEQSRSSDFMATVKEDLFKERVYVFTPKGDVIDLPAGSTPIDFAYRVHTEIGHRCRGAKVRGKLVSLDYQLSSGDQVEILTAKRGGPSRDWLNPNLGYVRTDRARTKIRQWFRQQNRDENITAGRQILERELNRLGIDNKSYQEIASLFKVDNLDDFLEKLGCGDHSPADVAERVLQLGKVEEPAKEASASLPPQEAPQPPAVKPSGDGVAVMGAGNMLTYLARCCNPVPPDEITGFVTRGRGVAVHRSDCPNVLRLDRERLIRVSWGASPPKISRVKIRVQAYDRAGLLNEITGVLKEENINLEDASAVTARQDNLALITATLEVRDAEQLSRVLTRIERLPNVQQVRRQKG